jgi:hypothetical protein
MTIAPSRRNDPTLNAAFRGGTVGVDEGQMDARCHANGDNPNLPILLAVVHAFECGSLEDEGRKLEIEPSGDEIGLTAR